MRLHHTALVVAVFLEAVFNMPLQVQGQTCPLSQVTLIEKNELSAPKGFDQLVFFDTREKKAVSSIKEVHGAPGAQTVTINTATIVEARDLKKRCVPAEQIQLRWGKKADPVVECLQPFDVAASPAANDRGAAGQPGNGDAPKAPGLSVTRLIVLKRDGQSGLTARLGDVVEVRTSRDLEGYLSFAEDQGKTVTLFLDGNDTGIEPEAIALETCALRFHLERSEDNKKVWSALLRDPLHHQKREVKASVGLAGGVGVPAERSTFTLVVVQWSWYGVLFLALGVGVLVVLFVKHDLLRDGPKPCPYSLGRCQMAWWFFLIIFGYMVIWLISGDQDTITPSLVALMGISAGTGLGAVLIDSTSGSAGLTQAATDRLALQAAKENEQKKVTAAKEAVAAAPTDLIAQRQLGDAQAVLAAVDAKLLAVNNQVSATVAGPKTRSFFHDILSDSNGTLGLHRFQIVVWTIVLGLIFIDSVVMELSMPVFSSTLLASMGISAGTYLGFKGSEK
ncbi:MAG TPA: hypothetical protein VOA80_15995 [Thermoanaerobaculia bacterium]|nr:hypothetical protein [Thermoanaerobaculia bacterium]